jgi:hypothetical protein
MFFLMDSLYELKKITLDHASPSVCPFDHDLVPATKTVYRIFVKVGVEDFHQKKNFRANSSILVLFFGRKLNYIYPRVLEFCGISKIVELRLFSLVLFVFNLCVFYVVKISINRTLLSYFNGSKVTVKYESFLKFFLMLTIQHQPPLNSASFICHTASWWLTIRCAAVVLLADSRCVCSAQPG